MSEQGYADKRAYFDRMLTLYGRKPALEALRDKALECHALHLAHSNREGGIVGELINAAEQRGIPVQRHSREELARISRNGKQDQGVALDVICPAFQSVGGYLDTLDSARPQRLLALDGITNPQNLGMIVRSAAAGDIDGLLWARKGNAAPGPLVVKASAGTLYRAPVLTCPELPGALEQCQRHGFDVCTLESSAQTDLFAYQPQRHCVFVLGNETDGVSSKVSRLAQQKLSIPMNNGVESLNVAVTASLIAYAGRIERG
ncbi:RNA methyltransferase [Halioglobus maricola]|uniref:RNA methyltransferase n=1 Tax=Halioglobus maricola TaxID=2601894 RepID=A0A5P9NK62_9GAMM|nr:RNA methyltransferase [Halioglobus maricola]QFU76157.1 RNA methyltransferase [Halioglobus maricola]